MRKNLVVLAAVLFAAPVFAADYTVDPAHSSIKFTVRHIVSKVNGGFRDFGGEFSFDEKKPESTHGKFFAKVASIDTANTKRDDHLKSPDFFDAQKFPEIDMVVKKVSKNGDKKAKMESDLTMHGVTKPVTWDVEYLGAAKGMMGNNVAGFTATTTVDRKAFGINWNKALDQGGMVLGDDVAIEIQVEAPQKEAAQKETTKKK